MSDLKRFLGAQQRDYATALSEIKAGRKISHWIWYIFPQIAGLGYSDMAKRYAIQNRKEAIAYLRNPVLGSRLIEIARALLHVSSADATEVMGTPDDLKLRSSMTLFALLPETDACLKPSSKNMFTAKKDKHLRDGTDAIMCVECGRNLLPGSGRSKTDRPLKRRRLFA